MSRADSPARKWSALVIDDDPSLQGFFFTFLARHGFAVNAAFNGREAYEYIRRTSYSVILLDLMMPDVNGLEVLERIQRESPWLLSRIIVMTGADQKFVDSVSHLPVWGVMRKPFEIDELLEAAKSCAEGRRAGVAENQAEI